MNKKTKLSLIILGGFAMVGVGVINFILLMEYYAPSPLIPQSISQNYIPGLEWLILIGFGISFYCSTKFIKEDVEEDCTGGKDGYGDYQQWLICKKKGHIAVNGIDDWLCLRCWTGWCIGMRFSIKNKTREMFRKGGLIKDRHVIGVKTNGSLVYSKIYEDGKFPFIDGVKIISYEEAIARGENTKAPDKGGPPYVYTLERVGKRKGK